MENGLEKYSLGDSNNLIYIDSSLVADSNKESF